MYIPIFRRFCIFLLGYTCFKAVYPEKIAFILSFIANFLYLCRPKKNIFYFRHFPQGSTSFPGNQERQQGVTQNSYVMPKVKTNSSAKKRFKVTGTGKIMHQKAFKRHILTKKSTKRKRNMRMEGLVSDANRHFVKRLLGLK